MSTHVLTQIARVSRFRRRPRRLQDSEIDSLMKKIQEAREGNELRTSGLKRLKEGWFSLKGRSNPLIEVVWVDQGGCIQDSLAGGKIADIDAVMQSLSGFKFEVIKDLVLTKAFNKSSLGASEPSLKTRRAEIGLKRVRPELKHEVAMKIQRIDDVQSDVDQEEAR
ncbi:hypothetical protein Tco_0849792 [Tanacetum coccineum]